MKTTVIAFFMLTILSSCANQSRVYTQKKESKVIFADYKSVNGNKKVKGTKLALNFIPGGSYINPTFAVWVQSADGKLVQTLYITKSFGTGIFARADAGNGELHDFSGPSIRPAALPCWSHLRGIINEVGNYAPTPENPVTDAYTGATPQSEFLIVTNTKEKLKDYNKIFIEVNQPWDSNEYWNKNKYPEDLDYLSSCQPSLIYEVDLDQLKRNKEFTFKPIGHGHFSGQSGEIYSDISTLTTAMDIFHSITLSVE